jgi:hypothetical protein
MKLSLLLIFSMALLRIFAMPVQAQASEDSPMVSRNNANGSQKFRLKVWKKYVCPLRTRTGAKFSGDRWRLWTGHFTKYQVLNFGAP